MNELTSPTDAPRARSLRSIRLSLGLIGAGLLLELWCVSHVTPASFVVFFVLGIPMIGAGILGFLRVVWRELKRSGAL